MEYLTKKKLINKSQNSISKEYWEKGGYKRWDYLSEVIKILKSINPERKKILEMGSMGINLSSVSDNMDITENIDSENRDNKKYIGDATVVPWSIEDKYYDVFVALQVFEHLSRSQSKVFKEIMRISKFAILSFPYKWRNKKDVIHYNITSEVISNWTLHFPYSKKIIVDEKVRGKINPYKKRIIYFFEFD